MAEVIDFNSLSDFDNPSDEYLAKIKKLEEQLAGVIIELKRAHESMAYLVHENRTQKLLLQQIGELAIGRSMPPISVEKQASEQTKQPRRNTSHIVAVPPLSIPKIRNGKKVPYAVLEKILIENYGLPKDAGIQEIQKKTGVNKINILRWRKSNEVPEVAINLLKS